MPVTELAVDRFETVIWATGHRLAYRWLDPALVDRRGMIHHRGGVAPTAGLFVIGRPFLRRRRSGLLAGIGLDAGELTDRVVAHLAQAVAA